jgi:hypothetical protein
MTQMPASSAVERLEARGGRWWGLDWPMTMSQSAVVVFGATALPWVGLIGLAIGLDLGGEKAVRQIAGRPLAATVMNVGNVVVLLALMMICARWVVAVASGKSLRSAAAGYAVAIVVAPAISLSLTIGCIQGRAATAAEIAWSLSLGLMWMIVQALLGRLVARMRRPYAEWLTLDVA